MDILVESFTQQAQGNIHLTIAWCVCYYVKLIYDDMHVGSSLAHI